MVNTFTAENLEAVVVAWILVKVVHLAWLQEVGADTQLAHCCIDIRCHSLVMLSALSGMGQVQGQRY